MFTAIILLTVGWVQDDWYTFEPGSKAFRVALPAKPNSTSSRSVSGPGGQAQLTAAQLRTPNAVYSIQVTENPARVNTKTLDDGIRRFATAKQATLGPLKTVTVNGNPGREFELTEGQKRSKLRFVASGKTLFVLSVTGMSGAGVPSEADRFLGSLEIGAAKENVASSPNPKVMTEAPDAKNEKAKAEAEAEIAKAKAEAEFAKIKAEAEIAKVKAEAEIAKVKAEVDRARAKSKMEVAAAKEPPMPDPEPEKVEDEPKDAAKTPAKKSNAPLKVTISRIPKNAKPYANENLEDRSRSFATERDGFRDIGPDGSILVGVRVTYIERFGGPKVRSVQPIYRNGKSHYAGRVYGEVVGPVTMVVAKPGYAVGGLVTHTGLTVDGFGMVFMKVDGDRLDPEDSYNSAWIGDRNGGSPGEATTKGGLIVGLQGRSKNEVNALGLTELK